MAKKLRYNIICILPFVFCILFQNCGPDQEYAIDEINKCKNINELKSLYLSSTFEDFKTEDNEDNIVLEFRKKIESFNLNDEELSEIDNWFLKRSVDFNIIILPDLSRRLKDYNYQSETDLKIINNITQKFYNLLKSKRGTNDRLLVDVVGNNQGGGKEVFDNLAENLSIDISKDNKKFAVEVFNERIAIFKKALFDLYENSLLKPQGADYWYYFNSPSLENHFKKSNAYTKFINIIVVVTDGYLEPEENVNAYMDANNLSKSKIPSVIKDYSGWKVILCEITERNKNSDFQNIQNLWGNWFRDMNIDCVKIIPNNPNINVTNNLINSFVESNCTKKKIGDKIENKVSNRNDLSLNTNSPVINIATDTDGDGLLDNIDKCPNEKGTASNNGCPIVIERNHKTVSPQNSQVFKIKEKKKRKTNNVIKTSKDGFIHEPNIEPKPLN